jgi:hypothetical protein
VQQRTSHSQRDSRSIGYDALVRLAIIIFVLTLATQAKAQWDIEDSHTTASLRGIDSVGDGVAWASGTNGTILRTEDGGYVWQLCAIPPGAQKLDFRGIQAFDANTAIVMSSGKGDLSRLYKTTDGCQTWKLIFTNPDKEGFWDAIQFASRDQGILLGDPVNNVFVVMLTFNGGEKWERQTLRAAQDINGEGIFAASNSSMLLEPILVEYRLGYRKFCTGGPGGPRVITLSTGPTDTPSKSATPSLWPADLRAERLPMKGPTFEGGGCFSLAADGQGSGTEIAVGGNFKLPNDPKNSAWTTARTPPFDSNNFSNWYPAKTPPHGYRSAVAYDAQQKLWITAGPNGTDISRDDGRNWTALKPTKEDSADADKNWNALSLPFVVGPNGRIGKLRPSALKP